MRLTSFILLKLGLAVINSLAQVDQYICPVTLPRPWRGQENCPHHLCSQWFYIPIFFKENGNIFDNFKDITEGFDDFFVNIGEKLQQELPVANKHIQDFLGTSIPYNFSFELNDEADILLECAKLKPKTS